MRTTVVSSSTPAQTAARRSSSSCPTRSSGRRTEVMCLPSSRSTRLVAGRPRSSTSRSMPSRLDHDHRSGARPGGVERPCEAVEQREAGGKAGGGIDLGRGLRLGADHVEAAGDPLHLGAVAGHEGRLDRAPAAAGGEHAILDGLGAGAANPGPVHGHHALAVLRVDQSLDRAAEQRVARDARELGQERRCVDERSGRVVERDQRAHVAREQPETLLPRVENDACRRRRP